MRPILLFFIVCALVVSTVRAQCVIRQNLQAHRSADQPPTFPHVWSIVVDEGRIEENRILAFLKGLPLAPVKRGVAQRNHCSQSHGNDTTTTVCSLVEQFYVTALFECEIESIEGIHNNTTTTTTTGQHCALDHVHMSTIYKNYNAHTMDSIGAHELQTVVDPARDVRWTYVRPTVGCVVPGQITTIKCNVRPRVNHDYITHYSAWLESRKSRNTAGLYAGSHWPWLHCPATARDHISDDATHLFHASDIPYLDNALTIVVDASALTDHTHLSEAVARFGQVTKDVDVRNDARTTTTTTTAHAVRNCDDVRNLVFSADTDNSRWLQWVREQNAEEWKDVTQANWRMTLPEGVAAEGYFSESASNAPLPLLHADTCLRYWNSHHLELRDARGELVQRVHFNQTSTGTKITNPFAQLGLIDSQRQCFWDAVTEARRRFEAPEALQIVRGSHSCHPNNANVRIANTFFDVNYRWVWSTTDGARNEGTCLNAGTLTHLWSAQACGADATSLVIVHVRDTKPPMVRTAFVKHHTQAINSRLVQHGIGEEAYAWTWRACYWPGHTWPIDIDADATATQFCPARDIVELVRRQLIQAEGSEVGAMFVDNCDTDPRDLQIVVDWKSVAWELCQMVAPDAQSVADPTKAVMKCTPQPTMDAVALSQGKTCINPSILRVNAGVGLATSTPILRISASVVVGDSCGNFADHHRLRVVVAFLDPDMQSHQIYHRYHCG